MVGREMKERFPKGNRYPGEVILEVEDLHALDPQDSSYEVLKGVSFNLRRGEILGIAGLMGSGRTELVTTLFGEYAKVSQGKIRLEGREITVRNSREAMQHGISLVPEDRKVHGLVLMQSILRNISLANLDRFASFMRIDDFAELKESLEFAQSLSIKAPNLYVTAEFAIRWKPTESGDFEMAYVQSKSLDHGRSHHGELMWEQNMKYTRS